MLLGTSEYREVVADPAARQALLERAVAHEIAIPSAFDPQRAEPRREQGDRAIGRDRR